MFPELISPREAYKWKELMLFCRKTKLHIAKRYIADGVRVGVAKFDCLTTDDDALYAKHGIPVLTGLSGNLCPDHFYVASVLSCADWGREKKLDILLLESAGLCNRCSPHMKNVASVCVIDNLMGAKTPRKIGPMLKKADVVAVTRGDVVSQAEREVFSFYVRQANPRALIMHVNGITGQGCFELSQVLSKIGEANLDDYYLRFTMPAAVCAYCVGERHLQPECHLTTMREMREYET